MELFKSYMNLLNQFGYIHLWGKGKEAGKEEYTQPEEDIEETPPELKPTQETPATIEGKKPEPSVTVKPPKVSKPNPLSSSPLKL